MCTHALESCMCTCALEPCISTCALEPCTTAAACDFSSCALQTRRRIHLSISSFNLPIFFQSAYPLPICKRALYLLKRALHIRHKAQYICKKTLYMCIRALYPIMEQITSPHPPSIRQRCLQSTKDTCAKHVQKMPVHMD